MKKIDMRAVIAAVHETVKNHELSELGSYCRWRWQNPEGTRKLGLNEYGCADALNILYTIDEFGCDEQTRLSRIAALRSMQNKESGMYVEATHNTIHTTAHCTAALELMDVRPECPIYALHPHVASKEALAAFMESIDWSSPWPESHKGAGIYAALVNSGEMTREIEDNYFEWLWDNADPESGFWRSGYANKAPYTYCDNQFGKGEPTAMYTYMAGGFHYMFNHEYARRPLRYPERIIDTCLKLYREVGMRDDFGKNIGFLEVDWVYCINRASRQTPHRFEEVKAAIADFAQIFTSYLLGLAESGEYRTHERFNDLHMLFGAVCAIAELQEALPGVIVTEKPLRLVLNRRPFI